MVWGTRKESDITSTRGMHDGAMVRVRQGSRRGGGVRGHLVCRRRLMRVHTNEGT